MVPELLKLKLAASMPVLPLVIEPKLMILAVVAEIPTLVVPMTVPKLTTVPVSKSIPRNVPVTLAPDTTVTLRFVSAPVP